MSCQPWSPIWTADISEAEPDLLDAAVTAATSILWAASGRRFGNCTHTESFWVPTTGACGRESWALRDLPAGVLLSEDDWHLDCALRLSMPHPRQVSSVVLKGVTLDPGEYVLQGSKLIRIGKCWPPSKDHAAPELTVSYSFGAPVPTIGLIACGELALDLYDLMDSGSCSLPGNVSAVSRQGVTIQMETATQVVESGNTGLKVVDRFVQTVNPHRLQQQSRILSPDMPRTAR